MNGSSKVEIETMIKLICTNVLTVGEKKDSTLHRVHGVKLPLLRAVWAADMI